MLIGGDLNEDLNKENGEKKSIYIKQFINGNVLLVSLLYRK
jgi:hypothetical protein